ncbi:MAG: alpha/beta fold hydrolase [Candidatus Margulisiibacteriota bacterium]
MDKTDVLYRAWGPPKAKAVLLLIHGIGAHSDRWHYLAQSLIKPGYAVYAIELKGFGETKEPRGHIESFDIYFQDIKLLYAKIKQDHPGTKIFIGGGSLGGLLSFTLAALNPGYFAGLVLLSPAFKGALKFKLTDLFDFFEGLLFEPNKKLKVPYFSSMATRDPKTLKKMNTDRREVRVTTSKFLLNVLLEQIRANFVIPKIELPVLFLVSGHDLFVSADESRKIFRRLPVKDKTLIEYPEMFHALSFDLGREKVFADLAGWLAKR